MNSDDIVMWVTLLSIVDWVYLKTQTLMETLRTRNRPREECYFSEAEHFVPISWMCKKQTSVSHSSTEFEIIFWDAGLRMDGLLALDLFETWKLKCYVQQTTLQDKVNWSMETCARQEIIHQLRKGKREGEHLSNVDNVPTNTHSSQV